jgi:hypothetical protein
MSDAHEDDIIDPRLRRALARCEGVLQMVEQIDEKHDEGHSRLRSDYRSLETKVESNYRHFTDQFTLLKGQLTTLDAKMNLPMDATKLSLTAKPIIAILGSVMGGAVLISTSIFAMRTDVKDLSTKVDAQQAAATARATLQDVQTAALRDALATTQKQAEDAKRSYELLRYDVQALKDALGKK